MSFADIKACTKCSLRAGCGQVVVGEGPVAAPVMIVGEAPGRDEDRSGIPFVGAAGGLLNRALQDVGIDRALTYVTNVVKCRPPDNRDPKPNETEACSPHLLEQIATIRPKVIITFGHYSSAFFAGIEPKDFAITRAHGKAINWSSPEGRTITVIPCFRPSYVLRNEHDPEFYQAFLADLSYAKTLAFADTASIPCSTGQRHVPPYHPEIRFITGWHIGNEVFLVHRTKEGARRIHRVPPEDHPYYFLVYAPDLTPKNKADFVRIMRQGIQEKRRTFRVLKIRTDPEIDCWIRVYPEVPSYWVSKSIKLPMTEEEGRMYTAFSPFKVFERRLALLGIRTFEADLDPLRRFMVDHQLTIEDHPRVLYYDIETDDSSAGKRAIKDVIGKVQILSIAAIDESGKTLFRAADTLSERAERDLLQWFEKEMFNPYDILVAWNGENFDAPFLWGRFRAHGAHGARAQKVIWWDALRSFKRHHKWDAEGKSTYSLDNVSLTLLGIGKVERRVKVVDLWNRDRAALEEYNVGDVDRLKRIEEKTGYVAIDTVSNVATNNFPGNPFISQKIDGLAMREGYLRGTHFRTRLFGDGLADDDQFTGAYVLDPERGLHRDVANFDFASLYPSVMLTFNVSPDTFVPEDEIPHRDAATLTTCPSFEIDGRRVGGTTFLKGPRGVLPSVYEVAAKNRAHYKQLMKTAPVDSPEWWNYRRHEYVWKEIGLSMYGVIGSPSSRYFNRAVAEAVTLSSQFLIRSTNRLASRLGFRPVYTDTDSCFISIPPGAIPAFLEKAHVLYRAICDRANSPECHIILEHQQVFSVLIIFKKKRYAGVLSWHKGQDADAIEVKGLEMRRSDGIVYARRMQEEAIKGILRDGWGPEQMTEFLTRHKRRVFSGELPAVEIAISKGLTKAPEEYGGRNLPHVMVAQELMERGDADIWIGSKIQYICVDARPPKKYIAVSDYSGVADWVYYWRDVIFPPTQRICEVLWPEVAWKDQFWVKRARTKTKG